MPPIARRNRIRVELLEPRLTPAFTYTVADLGKFDPADDAEQYLHF